MIKRVLLVLAMVVVAAGALVFRLPELVTRPGDTRALHDDLAMRPMHGDEAIHTDIFRRLWKEHDFEYNPKDFHGPTLHYFTLPVVWMTGAKEYRDTDEFTYRIVPLAFGVALVLMLALVADGLGIWGAIVAGVLTAISPAMVFFSRYYIQEMLLVFFTFGAIASGWRFLRARSWGGKILWAIALGVFVGLMHGTKETWAIAAVCAAVAAGLAWLTQGKRKQEGPKAEATERRSDEATKGWAFNAICAGVALLVAVVLGGAIISAGFKHPKAMLASVMSYKGNVARGAGENPHQNPWDFYLRTLVFWKGSRGVVWSEGLILALAAAGMGAGLRRWRGTSGQECPGEADKNVRPTEASRDPEDWVWRVAQASGSVRASAAKPGRPVATAADPQAATSTLAPSVSLKGERVQPAADKNACPTFEPSFVRFLAFYALGMIAIYSAIKYKTPWCELSFLHALILLAGVGAVYIVRRAPMLAIGAGVAMAAIYFSIELIRPVRGEPYLGIAMPKLWIMLALIGVIGLAALLPRIGVQILAAAVLMAWAAQLGSQAYRMNYWPQRLDSEYNPYIYGHPLLKVLDIPNRMEELAKASPTGHHMTITVVGVDHARGWDYWPIPWYLRSFDRVGYWDRVGDVEPSWLHADVLMFVLPEDQDIGVSDEMVQGYVSTHFGLRHRLPVAMYVKQKLWEKMLEGRAVKK